MSENTQDVICSAPGFIGGRVVDNDDDRSPVTGATLYLYQCVAVTETAEDGTYKFTGLTEGERYVVEFDGELSGVVSPAIPE